MYPSTGYGRDIAIQDHEQTFHYFEAIRTEREVVARNHEERFQTFVHHRVPRH